MFTKDEVIKIMDKFDKTSINKMMFETNESKLLLEKQSYEPNEEQPKAGNLDTEKDLKEDVHIIKAQMVGVFYKSASENEGNGVQVGDNVKKGEIIGVIEAMKVLNEIHSEVNGIIEDILVEEGEIVEFNQPIYKISKN